MAYPDPRYQQPYQHYPYAQPGYPQQHPYAQPGYPQQPGYPVAAPVSPPARSTDGNTPGWVFFDRLFGGFNKLLAILSVFGGGDAYVGNGASWGKSARYRVLFRLAVFGFCLAVLVTTIVVVTHLHH